MFVFFVELLGCYGITEIFSLMLSEFINVDSIERLMLEECIMSVGYSSSRN